MFINHCHVFPKGIFNKEKPHSGTIECLEGWMKKLKIEKAVIFALSAGNIEPNQWLLENLKGKKNLFPFATINPTKKNAAEKLEGYIKQGFVGVKIHPPVMKARIDSPAAEPFYAVAEKSGMPLLFHTGVHGWDLEKYMPILLDKVAQKHPKLSIIIEHSGGTAFFYQALAVLQNNQNCYAGLATVREKRYPFYLPPEYISILLRTLGAKRIIYGTDYPFNNFKTIKEDISIINHWKISEDGKERILGGNISDLVEKRKGGG